jgi:hypothetical protein
MFRCQLTLWLHQESGTLFFFKINFQFKKLQKISPEKSTREANQLSLTCTQISSSLFDFVVESFCKRVSKALEMRELNCAPDFRVRVFSERVEIFDKINDKARVLFRFDKSEE